MVHLVAAARAISSGSSVRIFIISVTLVIAATLFQSATPSAMGYWLPFAVSNDDASAKDSYSYRNDVSTELRELAQLNAAADKATTDESSDTDREARARPILIAIISPETDGTLGRTQNVKIVNNELQIFDRFTGKAILDPVAVSALWADFGGACETGRPSAAVFLYDQDADRWVVSRFAASERGGAADEECFAVSTSSDAAGSYYRYAFHLGGNFIDSPHLDIRGDMYFMSDSVYDSPATERIGSQFFNFDRTTMLSGRAAGFTTPGLDTGMGETYSISSRGVTINAIPESPASVLTINLAYAADSTFTSAGLTASDIVSMKAANTYAAQQFTNNFHDPINVNISVTAVGGTGTLGQSSTFLSIPSSSFTTMRDKTFADRMSADDITATGAAGSLPSTLVDPVVGAHYVVSTAQSKALAIATDGLSNDGTYTFGGGHSYTYDPNNRAVAGKFDYIGVSMHEFSEIMGRIGLMGQNLDGNPDYMQMDLFHFTGANTRGLNNGAGRNFSIDRGTTLLKLWNNNAANGGDLADWASGTNDCFNAFSSSGVKNDLSAVDIRNMDVIGYDLGSGSTPTNTPTHTATSTATNTATNTPTKTPTSTPTRTSTSTPTNTATNTPTNTVTNTPTPGPTNTSTSTPTATFTPTPSCGTTVSYTGPAISIPDNIPAGVDIALPVSGVGSISDLNFRFDTAGSCSASIGNTNAAMDHSYIGDLIFKLTSPAATSVSFQVQQGGTSENICLTNINDDGGFPNVSTIGTVSGVPELGNYSPETTGPLSSFDGQNANGTWILNVSDHAGVDTGSMRRFSLVFNSEGPCGTPTNTATNTPTATATSTPGGSSISGTITYPNATVPPKLISNVTVASTAGAPGVSTTTNLPGPTAGQYTLTGFGGGSYTITPTKPSGGVNGISSFDAARIAAHVAGSPPLTNATQKIAADVSNNNAISSFDAAEIANYVVAAAPAGLTGTWRFFTPNPTFPIAASPTNRTYASVSGAITGEDYVGILIGEVSGNWSPSAAPIRPAAGPERSYAVDLPDFLARSGEKVSIPVKVQGVAHKDIISYEFDLRFDPSVLQPLADAIDLATTVSRGLTAVSKISEPGLLKVAVYGPTPIDEDGLLLNLKFVAVGGPGSTTPLVWERFMFNEDEGSVMVNTGLVELSADPRIAADN